MVTEYAAVASVPRWPMIAEWAEMLKNAGFTVLGIFDGYTEKPLTDTSERAVYAVRKD